LALEAHRPVLVPLGICILCIKGLSQKNRVRGLPAPPGAPPVLGSLVRSAEGLPSMRNWPFRWPLSPTSPPQVIPKAM
jgi:hypothetical protein